MSNAAPPTTPVRTPDDQRRDDAREYVQQLRAFYTHAAVFAGSMVIIFVVNLATNLAAGIAGSWSAWWSGWALLGWSLGIGIHGLVMWLSRPRSSDPTWEERQIDEILSPTSNAPRR